jgi:N-acetylglucosaminyldiphosphoundecaprenol N-acetyl-beta-D-mannosaminyltransferase
VYITLPNENPMELRLSTPDTSKVLGYPVFTSTLDKLKLNSKTLISTINQYSYVMSERDRDFKEALLKSDVLLPDGIGITVASRFLTGKRINKIAGADIHRHFLEELNRTSGSCFYLGSAPATLEKIKARINSEYPNIKVGVYSPPYKAQFTEEDNQQMLDAVNSFKPDVLFVGMTAPKQEKWAHMHKEQLDAKAICAIGAVFDFFAGTVERPSSVWVNAGLEWLVRLVKEPKRMWRRYLYFGPVFVMQLIRAKVSPSYN